MTKERLIKKYANRRLYDASQSRHVTLEDIREFIVQGEKVTVVEDKSGEDITRLILLQVIAEQEHAGDPMMSQDFLAQVIRAYGGTMQNVVGDYLEQSLKLFTAQQTQIRDRMRSMVGMDPMSAMSNLAQENFQRWRQMQEAFLKSMTPPAPGRGDEPKE